jgi:hypothetical protein
MQYTCKPKVLHGTLLICLPTPNRWPFAQDTWRTVTIDDRIPLDLFGELFYSTVGCQQCFMTRLQVQCHDQNKQDRGPALIAVTCAGELSASAGIRSDAERRQHKLKGNCTAVHQLQLCMYAYLSARIVTRLIHSDCDMFKLDTAVFVPQGGPCWWAADLCSCGLCCCARPS